MNKKIIAKHNMFTNVDQVFTENGAIVDRVPALKAQVVLFHNGFESLGTLMQPLQLSTTGNAKAKREAKERLSKIGATVCGAMRSYANDHDKPVVLSQADYSTSDLLKLRDLELQETGQALYLLANGMADELADYGIKADELNNMGTAVSNFAQLSPQVRKVKVDNKTLRKQLTEKVEEIDNMLRSKLDNGMLVMEFGQPAFFDLYRNARRNYSLGVRHEQPGAENERFMAEMESIAALNGASNPAVTFKDTPVMNGNGAAV